MDFTASPAAGMTAATPPLELGRQRDAGFFAVERSANRLLTERLGGPLARFYLALALECPKHDPTRFPSASVADIAEWTGDSPKAVRRWLTELERLGCIAWTRPANQHTGTGELRLLVNLHRFPPKSSKPAEVAAEQLERAASPAVDNIAAEVVPFPCRSRALPETDRATLVVRDVHRTQDIHRTPEHALTHTHAESGGYTTSPPVLEPAPSNSAESVDVVPNAQHQHRELTATLERAADHVVKARERTHGPGGRGAHRKARRELEAELGEKAAAWLAAGCEPNRVAEALADRFTGTNLGAVPWSPGAAPASITTSPPADLEPEQLEPITEAEWDELPESVRTVMAERCPNLTPLVAR